MSDGIKGLHQGAPHFVGPGKYGIAPSLDPEVSELFLILMVELTLHPQQRWPHSSPWAWESGP